MHDETIVTLIAGPSEDELARIATTVVEERLAACASIVPRMRSIYRWEGEVQDEAEALLIVKTLRSRFELLRARVVALHGYEVPEVVALPVVAGHGPYLDWVRESVGEG